MLHVIPIDKGPEKAQESTLKKKEKHKVLTTSSENVLLLFFYISLLSPTLFSQSPQPTPQDWEGARRSLRK